MLSRAVCQTRCSVVPHRVPFHPLLPFFLQQVAATEDGAILQRLDVGSAVNATVSGLSPNTRYVFRLEVLNEAGAVTGAWTSTRTLFGLPLPVAAPELEVVSATRIFVAWSPPANAAGAAVAYQVFQGGVAVASTATTLYRADGLLPYTQYTFSVRACTDSGCANGTASTARTMQALPEGVAVPTVTEVAAHSLSLQWTAPTRANGPLASYAVWLRTCDADAGCTSGNDGSEVQNVAGDITTAMLAGLTPYTNYEVRVEARNGAGSTQSAWQSVFVPPAGGTARKLRTLAALPEVKTGLACVLLNETAVRCLWSASTSFVANGPASGYTIQVRDDDAGGAVREERQLPLAAEAALFSPLAAGNLTFRLVLTNSVGEAAAVSRQEVPGPTPVLSTMPPVSAGSNDANQVASGGVAGIVVGLLLLVLLLAVLVARTRRSKVTTLLTEVDSPVPAGTKLDFWEIEERLVRA